MQGTGNGHLSRARAVIPALRKFCRTDILVSGYQSDVILSHKLDFKYRGLSFIFGKLGGVDIWKTCLQANLFKLRHEIDTVPVERYDLVINDFEPVTAWACRKKEIPCISLSHQAAVLDKHAPQPKRNDLIGKFVLENYAPSSSRFGFHFDTYSPYIYTPVIRDSIRHARILDKGHYTVYLPAYGDKKLIDILSAIRNIKWQVFSKHNKSALHHENVDIYPIDNEQFIESFRTICLICKE